MTLRRTAAPERRPIAARRWGSARALAGWLARRGVSPNAVSIAGLVCGVGAGVALATTALAPAYARVAWVGAAALIGLRASANMLDGMVAVEFGRASPVGELYNEVPDRVSDATMLIGLGYASGGIAWLGYTTACAAVLVAYVRAVGRVAGGAKTARPHMHASRTSAAGRHSKSVSRGVMVFSPEARSVPLTSLCLGARAQYQGWTLRHRQVASSARPTTGVETGARWCGARRRGL